MKDLGNVVERLCEISRNDFSNPFDFDWPQSLELDQWFTSPEFISLYGTKFYESLDEPARKRLSFYEAVNFFSLNIHGEKPLVEGLAQRLYDSGSDGTSAYLHHFLDEENKHMVYFAGFCLRYAGKIYPDKKMILPREYEPGEEDFLFFAKVLIFEEIVDLYNIRMSQDERLVPVVRQIHWLHHRDEARHLVFGRRFTAELFERYKNKWSPPVLQGVRDYLSEFLTATWKEYYNPDVYRDAGLMHPYQVFVEAFDDPRCRSHREQISAGCIRYLMEHDMITERPRL
jgi:hypothetical protein